MYMIRSENICMVKYEEKLIAYVCVHIFAKKRAKKNWQLPILARNYLWRISA